MGTLIEKKSHFLQNLQLKTHLCFHAYGEFASGMICLLLYRNQMELLCTHHLRSCLLGHLFARLSCRELFGNLLERFQQEWVS